MLEEVRGFHATAARGLAGQRLLRPAHHAVLERPVVSLPVTPIFRYPHIGTPPKSQEPYFKRPPSIVDIMPLTLEVRLLSGRSVSLAAAVDETVAHLTSRAQEALAVVRGPFASCGLGLGFRV